MARKYLNDIGIDDTVIGIKPDDKRWEVWNCETEKYGFASYETWNLDTSFYAWLYERLCCFLEVAVIDFDAKIESNMFEYNGDKYTLHELIDKMLHGCEIALKADGFYIGLSKEDQEVIEEVVWIWATVMPAMWW